MDRLTEKKLKPGYPSYIPIVLGIFVGALLARVPLLFQPMWYDEAFTLWLAGLDWGRLIEATAGDVHPPAWYVLTKAWVDTWGMYDVYALRVLALLLGLGAIYLVYQVLGKLSAPESVQWLTTWLACFSPVLVYYSAEARMYSLLLYLILLALYNALSGYGLPFALSLLLGALTQNMFFLYAPFIAWIAWQKMGWRAVAWSGIAAAAYGVVWLPRFLVQLQNVTTAYWIPDLSPGRAVFNLYTLLAGPGHHESVMLVTVPFLLVFVLTGAVLAWREKSYNLLLLAFGPLVLGVVLSLLLRPVLIPRVLIGCTPFLLALVAWTQRAVLRRLGTWSIAPLMAVLLVTLFSLYLFPTRTNWEQVYSQVPVQPGDTCYHLNASSLIMTRFLFPDCNHYLWPAEHDLAQSITSHTKMAMGIRQGPIDDLTGQVWLFHCDGPHVEGPEYAEQHRILDTWPPSRALRINSNPITNTMVWRVDLRR